MRVTSLMFVTNAIKRGDVFIEAIKSHMLFSDEMILVDGCSTDGTVAAVKKLKDKRIKYISLPWPEDYTWEEFATHANIGYEHATGDWVATGESDHVFTPEQAKATRETLYNFLGREEPIVEVGKLQITAVDRFFSKARIPYFINKKRFGATVGYGIDPNECSDLGKPIIIKKQISKYFYEGTLLKPETRTGLEMLNYHWTFKTFEQVLREKIKMNKAWNRQPVLRSRTKEPEEEQEVANSLAVLMKCKYERSVPIRIDHPPIMMDKIKAELKPGMYGYDICGIIDHKPIYFHD